MCDHRGARAAAAVALAAAWTGAAGCGSADDPVVGDVPRGVAALGGDGFIHVRYAPVPGAEHAVLADRDGSFERATELEHIEPGVAIHEDVEPGQTWFYMVVADRGEGAVAAEPVSAETVPNELPSLYVEMDASDVDELYDRDPHKNDRLPAEVFVGDPEGPALDVDGLRFRGATTRFYDKKNFNIRLGAPPALPDFPEFNFRKDGERRAGTRLILNALWTDPSAMREALSLEMFRALGLVTPSYEFTELHLNGAFEGLYLSIERIDRELLRGAGLNPTPGEHTLVRDEAKANRGREEISRRSVFGNPLPEDDGEAIDLLQAIFRYRGDTEDHDWDGLLDLIRWVNGTPAGSAFEAGFRERFDADRFIDFLAIHALTHDRDVLDIDYWLYRDEAAGGPWRLIPWDKNLTFGAHYHAGVQGVNDFFDYYRDFIQPQQNALVEKFLDTPGLRADFDARLVDLATEVFDDAWYREVMEEMAGEIAPALARPPGGGAYRIHPGQHHGALGWWKEHKQTLLDFVRLRRAFLLAALDREDEAVARGRRVVDDEGWVVAEFRPDGDVEVDLSVDAQSIEEPGWRGIDREYRVEVSEPVTGQLVLYWRHNPVASWYEELEIPGTQWYMDGYRRGDGGHWERLPSRVWPFSNKIELEADLGGPTRFRVGYVPESESYATGAHP